MTFVNYYKDDYDIEKYLKRDNKVNIGAIEFSLNRSNYDNIKGLIKNFNPF